jgi:hypothetical protein
MSVITSSTIRESSLNKRHNAISYHLVRECVAAKIIYLLHIDGRLNPSDILTKALGWVKFWPLIQPLLFWKGETILKKIAPVATETVATLIFHLINALHGFSRIKSLGS